VADGDGDRTERAPMWPRPGTGRARGRRSYMSKKKIPAGDTGGDGTTPIPEFPPKLRVHALAKALGTSSREVLAALADLGEVVRSPQSSVSREVAEQLATTLLAIGHQDVE